jgi:hypothetical protein
MIWSFLIVKVRNPYRDHPPTYVLLTSLSSYVHHLARHLLPLESQNKSNRFGWPNIFISWFVLKNWLPKYYRELSGRWILWLLSSFAKPFCEHLKQTWLSLLLLSTNDAYMLMGFLTFHEVPPYSIVLLMYVHWICSLLKLQCDFGRLK